MLPGLRFIFAAIVLFMSVLVFGFGATALLSTAREEFASTPAWQPLPETRFAQKNTPAKPVLAMLRVNDAPKVKPSAPPADQPAPKTESPAPDPAPIAAAPVVVAPVAEQQVTTATPEPVPSASAPSQPSAADVSPTPPQ